MPAEVSSDAYFAYNFFISIIFSVLIALRWVRTRVQSRWQRNLISPISISNKLWPLRAFFCSRSRAVTPFWNNWIDYLSILLVELLQKFKEYVKLNDINYDKSKKKDKEYLHCTTEEVNRSPCTIPKYSIVRYHFLNLSIVFIIISMWWSWMVGKI